MTLVELQKILGDRVTAMVRTGDKSSQMTSEERKAEMDMSQSISLLAKQMINNADVILRTNKLVADGSLKSSTIENLVG